MNDDIDHSSSLLSFQWSECVNKIFPIRENIINKQKEEHTIIEFLTITHIIQFCLSTASRPVRRPD
jgi:hypothetical protein